MKKQWMRGVAALLSAALFCCGLLGCSSDRPQDGTYTARYRNASGGYVEYLTVTFRDGKVTQAEFDGYLENDPSKLKSKLTKEEYPMDPHPSEWIPLLSKNVKAAGTEPNKIATVAGATSSTGHARELYKAILDAAADGKTGEIVLENQAEAGGLNGGMSDSDSNGMSGSDSGLPDGMTGGSDSMDSSSDVSGSGSDSGMAGGSSDTGMSGSAATDSSGSSDGTIPDGNSSTDTADGPGNSGSSSDSGGSSGSSSSSNDR